MVVIVKLLQKGAENGMFGHPAGNAFALVSPSSWLWNDKTYRRVITRNGPVHQVFEDMREAVKISRLSQKLIDENAINP